MTVEIEKTLPAKQAKRDGKQRSLDYWGRKYVLSIKGNAVFQAKYYIL